MLSEASRLSRWVLMLVYPRLKAILARMIDCWRHWIVIAFPSRNAPFPSSEQPKLLRRWVTIKPKRAGRRSDQNQVFARKFHRFNGEQDLPHGKHLSISRVALQPFDCSTG